MYFFLTLLIYNGQRKLYLLNTYVMIHNHCEIFTTIKFINTSTTLHSCLVYANVMITLKMYSLSKCQEYNIVLVILTIGTMLYHRHLLILLCYSLLVSSGNHHPMICFYESISDTSYKSYFITFILLFLDVLLSVVSSRFICAVKSGRIYFWKTE